MNHCHKIDFFLTEKLPWSLAKDVHNMCGHLLPVAHAWIRVQYFIEPIFHVVIRASSLFFILIALNPLIGRHQLKKCEESRIVYFPPKPV